MGNGYKKYMKKDVKRGNSFLQIFVITFFSTLLICTFLIKSFSPKVDTSIGDYQDQSLNFDEEETKKIDNNSLEKIQDEDRGRNFSELMSKPDDVTPKETETETELLIPEKTERIQAAEKNEPKAIETSIKSDPVYKVFIGSYTSAEQARVAKDIIQESGANLNPIVKCLGLNNYTLQVGIFKNKQSAESLLYTIQQNHLPGRVVQDY